MLDAITKDGVYKALKEVAKKPATHYKLKTQVQKESYDSFRKKLSSLNFEKFEVLILRLPMTAEKMLWNGYPKPNDSVEKLKKQKNYFFCQEDCKQFKCIIALVYKFYPTKKMQLVRMRQQESVTLV